MIEEGKLGMGLANDEIPKNSKERREKNRDMNPVAIILMVCFY